MVNYPNLSSLDNSSGIAGLMALPNASYPFFWAWILGGIWVIISLTMYFADKRQVGKEKILSSLAVSSFTIIFLASIGTVLEIVPVDIMINFLVFGLVIIAIWFFSDK